MHAILFHADIKPDAYETAKDHIDQQLMPTFKDYRGIIAGYWLEPEEKTSDVYRVTSVVLFQDEECAREAAEQVSTEQLPEGFSITGTVVRQVITTA